jgi:hypothetical protein
MGSATRASASADAVSARAATLAVLVAVLLAPESAMAADVHVATAISPRPARFGDVVHATLTVRAGSAATVQEGFAPFEVLREASTSARDGAVVVTTWRFDLQCLAAQCTPGPGPRSVRLSTSRVQVGSRVIEARFPAVRVDPRVTQKQVGNPQRYFLHPTTPPSPTFQFSPSTVRRALVAVAALLALVAGLLVFPLVRPHLARTGGVHADPLARALALVRAARSRPPPDRRRALGLLSRTLRSRGEPAAGQTAADLAWSEPEPEPARMTQLVDRIEGSS